MDFIGALRPCGGSHNKVERQAAFLHALHDGILACARRPRDDDEQRLWMMDIEFRMRGGNMHEFYQRDLMQRLSHD